MTEEFTKFFAAATLAFLSACAPSGPILMSSGGGSSGGHDTKQVAVDHSGMPILGSNEEVTHGGTSNGGTPINDIGGHGTYNPAPVTQTEQIQPIVHDNPAPAPTPAPEPTNTDFGAVSK